VNRLALAILGVIVAVACLVAIARQTSADKAAGPAPPVTASAPAPEPGPDPNDVQLEVKELTLADGGADRTSIRVDHPDPGVQAKLREFLEPREQAAIAKNTPLDCHAQIAKTSLISITCVTIVPAEPSDAEAATNDAGPKTEPRYESLTLRFARGAVKQLALADVLTADAGEAEVTAGCKKASEPDLACNWPPTDFAISPGGTLFICHGSHCVDIDADDAPNLLRREFR
jgi:hypothetical protein